MKLFETLYSIQPADAVFLENAQKKWDSIAKPLGSLGVLEDAIIQICGATRDLCPKIEKRAVVVFCADNGIVAEGVTQTSSDVTTIVAKNLCTADTSVCKMSAVAGCDVVPVDVGMIQGVDHPKMRQCSIAKGTNNFKNAEAMTKTQAISAIEVGIQTAIDLSNQSYLLFAVGEMGIGNTTTSSAVASVLLQKPVEKMTGKGAGLSATGVQHKIAVIKDAITLHNPDCNDPLDILHKVGGFDIAAMTGMYIGCAFCKKVAILDGFIAGVAALLAVKLCPAVSDYLLASHVSAEPAGRIVLDALEKTPMITAEMRLGEGTGAVAAMPLLDMALNVFNTMTTFESNNIKAYKPL